MCHLGRKVATLTGNSKAGVMPVTEDLFRIAADVAPGLVWMSGPDKLYTFFNKSWLDFTGRPIERELGNGWTDGVHPDDSRRVWIPTRVPSTAETLSRWSIGCGVMTVNTGGLDAGLPLFSPDGSFAGYIGSCWTSPSAGTPKTRCVARRWSSASRSAWRVSEAGRGTRIPIRSNSAERLRRQLLRPGSTPGGSPAIRTTERSFPQKAGCSCSARSKRRSARGPRLQARPRDGSCR